MHVGAVLRWNQPQLGEREKPNKAENMDGQTSKVESCRIGHQLWDQSDRQWRRTAARQPRDGS